MAQRSSEKVHHLEPWMTLREFSGHLKVSERWLKYRVSRDGCPSAIIAGRRKFKPSEAEAWLEAEGHMTKKSV